LSRVQVLPPPEPSPYADRIPATRPPGLRLTTLRRSWYRLDAAGPEAWSWAGFPEPRYRFDPAGGGVRVRYAGATPRSAMRERFDDTGRHIPRSLLDLRLVELTGPVRVLDLRLERNLDALGLDDQISTGRSPEVWTACQRLSSALIGWYGERLEGIAYRSRTTPQSAFNLAFVQPRPDRLVARDLGRLGDASALLAACVLSDGFTVQGW
jgi:hypothetical protein